MNLLSRIFIITIFTVLVSGGMGYAVFTTGNAPNVLNEDVEIFYLIVGVYILSVTMVWITTIINEIKLSRRKK